MIAYKKLPKGTPRWLTICILLLGGALGVGISVYALTTLYGLSAFLVNLFFPGAGFEISSAEALYLGVVGASAALTGTLVSTLAIRMNGLSKKAIGLSRIIWAPALVTTILVTSDLYVQDFTYTFPTFWVAGIYVSLVFCSILPWLLLRTKPAQKVHNK